MKKLISILSLLFVLFTANAQTREFYDVKFYSGYLGSSISDSKDTVVLQETPVYYVIHHKSSLVETRTFRKSTEDAYEWNGLVFKMYTCVVKGAVEKLYVSDSIIYYEIEYYEAKPVYFILEQTKKKKKWF